MNTAFDREGAGMVEPPAIDGKALLRELAREVDSTHRDAGFRAALEAMARFWRYSATNAWHIVSQFPRATQVAGRLTWAKLGRQVLPDARPIQILAPVSPRGFPFILVDVFDVKQTRGRKVPRLELERNGNTPYADRLLLAAARLGIAVVERHHPLWLGRSLGGTIEMRPGLSEVARASVLAHELAHEILHRQRSAKKRRLPLTHVERETEAEATAYVVLRAFGLPSTAATYIAWQSGDGETILRSLGRVHRSAQKILEAVKGTRVDACVEPPGSVTVTAALV